VWLDARKMEKRATMAFVTAISILHTRPSFHTVCNVIAAPIVVIDESSDLCRQVASPAIWRHGSTTATSSTSVARRGIRRPRERSSDGIRRSRTASCSRTIIYLAELEQSHAGRRLLRTWVKNPARKRKDQKHHNPKSTLATPTDRRINSIVR
jgi:hypothetical protein